MPASAAFCSASESVVPSMAAITRTFSFLVIMFSIWASWFGNVVVGVLQVDLVALRLSTLTMLSPSAIQRADDLVGIDDADRALVLRLGSRSDHEGCQRKRAYDRCKCLHAFSPNVLCVPMRPHYTD